jgi:hypothetical protein
MIARYHTLRASQVSDFRHPLGRPVAKSAATPSKMDVLPPLGSMPAQKE